MKFLPKLLVSALLSLMILISGTGISLAKMVCLKSGNSIITMNTPDDCCQHEHEHAPVTIEEKCCDVSNLNVDALHFVVSSSHHLEKAVTAAALPVYIKLVTSVDVIAREYTPDFHGRIPEMHSPSIRILIQSFQV